MKKLFTIFFITLFASNATFAQANVSTTAAGASFYQAPELEGITNWINSEPIKIKTKLNKVVLIDFWTYSCINCIRTIPFMNSLYEKYAGKGLIIVSVHSPEFEFEKDINNINAAVRKFGIKYPVAVDSNMMTWRAYNNNYWPAHYLINKLGQVVYTHFGEGNQDELENNIRALLGIPGDVANERLSFNNVFAKQITPETYLGGLRAQRNANAGDGFKFPETLSDDAWALDGKWGVSKEYSANLDNKSALRMQFNAKKVFLVMSAERPTNIEILIDGKPITSDIAGGDVRASSVLVRESRLYELVKSKDSKSALLEIRPKGAGVKFYAFTFGN